MLGVVAQVVQKCGAMCAACTTALHSFSVCIFTCLLLTWSKIQVEHPDQYPPVTAPKPLPFRQSSSLYSIPGQYRRRLIDRFQLWFSARPRTLSRALRILVYPCALHNLRITTRLLELRSEGRFLLVLNLNSSPAKSKSVSDLRQNR